MLLRARGLTKRFGDFVAVDGIDVEVRSGRGVRVPRAQRRRQVLDDADGRLRLAGHRGRADDLRTRPGPGRPADPGAARRGPAEGHPRRRSSRVRENLWVYGRYFGLSRAEVKRRAVRAARVRPAGRPGDGQGRAPLRRHEAAAHDRPLADQRARACCCSTSRPPGSTRRPGTSSGTGCSGSSGRASPSSLTTHYMDEAEQLCDRLVVMDKRPDRRRGLAPRADRRALDPRGRSSCGSTSASTTRRSRPALERRSATGVEVLPDRVLLYADDGDAALAAVTGDGLRPDLGPGAPLHPGGRLPPPHRPHPGRLTWRRRPHPVHRTAVDRSGPPAGRSLAVRLRVPAARLPPDLAGHASRPGR